MAISVVTPPARLPLTLAEVKDFARIYHSVEDAEIEALIAAIVTHTEGMLGRRLITQVIDWRIDRFPVSVADPVLLLFSPAQSVDLITYVDSAGITQTWPASEYQVDLGGDPARLLPACGEQWPVTRRQLNAVTIQATYGYGDNAADVEPDILIGMKQLIATNYEQRSAVVLGTSAVRVPGVVDLLLNPYIVSRLFA